MSDIKLPEPDRTMWQYGQQINHYTENQMRDYALAVSEADNAALRAELFAHQVYIRVLCKAVDAATDFAGTVAGGASWWDDVWAEHFRALDAARAALEKP